MTQADHARVSPGRPAVRPNAAARTAPGRPETFLSQPLPNARGGPCFAGHLSRQMMLPNSRGTKRSPNQWSSRLLSAQVAGSSPAGGTGRSQFRRSGPAGRLCLEWLKSTMMGVKDPAPRMPLPRGLANPQCDVEISLARRTWITEGGADPFDTLVVLWPQVNILDETFPAAERQRDDHEMQI